MEHESRKAGLGRREALKNMSLVFTAASSLPAFAGLSAEAVFAQGEALHKHAAEKSGSTKKSQLLVLDAHQNETVATLCELIIPQASTPGARAAKVNEFIDTYLSSLTPSARLEFLEGLQWVDLRSQELFGQNFVRATAEQQNDLLTRLSVIQSIEAVEGQNFFKQIKSLTVFGYYTSKVGIEDELKFEGWIEYRGCTHPEHQA